MREIIYVFPVTWWNLWERLRFISLFLLSPLDQTNTYSSCTLGTGEHHIDFQTLSSTLVQPFFVLTTSPWKTRQKEITAWLVKCLFLIVGFFFFFLIQIYQIYQKVLPEDRTVSADRKLLSRYWLYEPNWR